MKYIISKAYTGSEWDTVDFALIELDDERLKYFKEMEMQAKELKERNGFGFMHIEISADNAEFFTGLMEEFEDNTISPGEMIPEEEEYCIEELPDDIIDKLERPESHLKYGSMKFSDSGVQFTTLGKHTDEEFWTPTIPYSIFEKIEA